MITDFREKVNTILSKKGFLIAFSLIASIALWSYVSYVENPEVTQTVSNVKVIFTGEEELHKRNLTVTSKSDESIVLRFSGRRTSLAKLNGNNVTVTVDLAELAENNYTTGRYSCEYKINLPQNVPTNSVHKESATTDYITVTLEELATAKIPVKGMYNGNVAEGFQAEPMEITPNYVTVSGTAAVVSRIKQAWITLDVDELDETYETKAKFTLQDDDGAKISDENIRTDISEVNVKIPIIMVKTVKLGVNVEYSKAITEQNAVRYMKIGVSPETITLSGSSEDLKNLETITLGTIAMTDFASSTFETYDIPIPDDVKNVTGSTKATVTVEVVGLDTVGFDVTNITPLNVTEGYNAHIETQSVYIRVRGLSTYLGSMTSDNIKITADLSELGNSSGTYSVQGKVYVDGYKYVDVIGDYYVTVTVQKAGEKTEKK